MASLATGLLAGCSATDDMGPDSSGPEEIGEVRQALTLEERTAGCQNDPRVLANLVSVDVCVGADFFLRDTFDGNGRSCASCHAVENNFTIDPEFIATLPPNDPLFVAEFNPTLANLERPEQLRARSLILENADGFDPDPNVRFVLRSVPHNLSMDVSVDRPPGSVSPPVDRTGWSGDGAPDQGRLTDFQNGAITQHYTQSLDRVAGVDFRLATEAELQTIDLFMRRLGRTNDIHLPGVSMSDAGAEAGRQAFLDPATRCNTCHVNAGANASFGGGGNRNFNTGVEAARAVALADFPADGGFGRTPENADGSFGDQTFNTPPLVEAADTGPFFHTATTVSGASAHNASEANTIEQAVAFYDTPAFNNSPSGAIAPIDLSASQIDNIARFLRALNAAFNAQMAVKRLDGALELVNHFQNNHLGVQRRMLELARVEIDDALEVLSAVPNLNSSSQSLLSQARSAINTAIATSSHVTRQSNISQARNATWDASTRIGSIFFIMGEGNFMF